MTSVRNLTRFKLYSFINILGLTIGFTAFILIFIFVKHELSFDQFHERKDVIVKANLEFGPNSEDTEPVSVTPTALLPTFKRTFPEVTGGTRYVNISSYKPANIQKDGQVVQEWNFAYADSTFFDVFSFPFLSGDPKTALTEPKSLVLTRSSALKYFDNDNPLGEELIVNNASYIVKGIIEDLPNNSHIDFTMLGSFSSLNASKSEIWGSASYFTYLTLSSKNDLKKLDAKIQQLLLDVEYSQPEQGFYANVKLVPLTDIYLKSEADALSDIKYIYLFSAIALIILVIASINYINLATARSVTRAREVGIRKVSGAGKSQLLVLFISEAVVVSLISLFLAYITVYLSIDVFNNFSGKNISDDFILEIGIIGPVFSIALLTGFISGIYPSMLLSSYNPSTILKGNFSRSGKGSFLRKSLVIIQFSVSIIMIIATLVISDQLSYVQNKNLGYHKEAIISLPMNRSVMERSETIKNTLINTGYVESVTMAYETPVFIKGGYSIWGEGMAQGISHGTTAIPVDEDFLQTFNIPLISGLNFDQNDLLRSQDEEENEYSFILNQKAVEILGWTADDALGKKVDMNGRAGKIKGVINDFHFRSLHQEIGPLVLFTEMEWSYNYIMIKLNTIDNNALSSLESVWKEMAPDLPFAYKFISDEFNQLYTSEQTLGQLFKTFSGIAILVACLGLFGLASFTSFQRSREVSIRKVLGASSRKLLFLLSKDFLLLVIFAFIIAAPIGYIGMNFWLQNFEYRTAISSWQLITAFFGTSLIAFLTVSYHALKSARANPAEVLKNE
jgi:putative ABC transport system permease protein